jgi:EAL domain-containing protein (putative c-di-GMP-specific phosphodiesterase class I)
MSGPRRLSHPHKLSGVPAPRPGDPGAVQALFQPIERLRTGEIVGFEALARLVVGDVLLPPAAFLTDLTARDRADLFCVMLDQAIGLLRSVSTSGVRPYVSVNVEPSLLLAEGFLDRMRAELGRLGYPGDGALVIELLESDEILDFAAVVKAVEAVKSLGIGVALDDVGSAYASLTHLRELPVDAIKLDQSFARRLDERPEDLHFTLSLQSLANGLGKRLIVEGIETADIHDGLRVLGVDLGQGYAIARPMPGEAVGPWLAARTPGDFDPAPNSLLGAYAGHLKVVESCRLLMDQPLPIAWRKEAKDPHACAIGRYFDRQGTHETDYGRAHKAFHAVMAGYNKDPEAWQARAEQFRLALTSAILSGAPCKDPCR